MLTVTTNMCPHIFGKITAETKNIIKDQLIKSLQCQHKNKLTLVKQNMLQLS